MTTKRDLLLASLCLLVIAIASLLVNDFLFKPKENWKTYRNERYGFSFSYPKDWLIWEWATPDAGVNGSIVSLRSPETERLFQKGEIYPASSYNLTISFWPSINNEYARGGGFYGEKSHKSLAEYFTDKDTFKSKEKIGDLTIAGQKAHEVIIGGAGASYGVMIEYKGIYQLSFETAWDKSQLGSTEKQILSTFRFLK